MNPLHGIKALIFDMDGVIVDSEPLHLLSYQEIFSGHEIHYTEEHNREFLGCKDLAMCSILIERHSLPYTPEQMVQLKEEILERMLREHAPARPGLYRTLEKCRENGIKTAIASSATLRTIGVVVECLKIGQYFDVIASGEEVKHGKPAPDVFLLAAQRLGVTPSECLVIEDTLNGIRAAKAAGMRCLAIPCEATMHQDHSMADAHLSSLEQLNFAESAT